MNISAIQIVCEAVNLFLSNEAVPPRQLKWNNSFLNSTHFTAIDWSCESCGIGVSGLTRALDVLKEHCLNDQVIFIFSL